MAWSVHYIIHGNALGIIALVDEATGFQYDRARDALAKILERFIAKELRGWTKTFPSEFYEQIFRLHNWNFDPASVKRPSVIGHYTNDIVYKRLAPGVLTRKNHQLSKMHTACYRKIIILLLLVILIESI